MMLRSDYTTGSQSKIPLNVFPFRLKTGKHNSLLIFLRPTLILPNSASFCENLSRLPSSVSSRVLLEIRYCICQLGVKS